jgi:hypothetical protein
MNYRPHAELKILFEISFSIFIFLPSSMNSVQAPSDSAAICSMYLNIPSIRNGEQRVSVSYCSFCSAQLTTFLSGPLFFHLLNEYLIPSLCLYPNFICSLICSLRPLTHYFISCS